MHEGDFVQVMSGPTCGATGRIVLLGADGVRVAVERQENPSRSRMWVERIENLAITSCPHREQER